MERRKSESIAKALLHFLRESGLETPLNEYRLIQSWGKVVGSAVAQRTVSLKIYNQVLYVKLKSPALRSEMMMQRTLLTAKLNAAVKANVITYIVFS